MTPSDPRPNDAERASARETEPSDERAADDARADETTEDTLAQDSQSARSSGLPTDWAARSDVQLASDHTAPAPSYRPPAPRKASHPTSPAALEPGARIDDFEVVKVLGKGAFGVVYLARQVSLDRHVALKVAANEGSEGRTMARLEHDHIVQVFSESVDESGRLRILCMQLVPGASLEGVIRNLHPPGEPRDEHWTGRDYLAIVESRSQVADVLDTSALRDREMLDDFDAVQATAWVGARLAEAVDYAHRQGVLHRDIKPANVLVNQYGRPMLADFNISFRSFDDKASPDSTFGGTLAFMAPEHLEAFNPESPTTAADVDEQSDVYSLGIVVHELLTGRSPFKDPRRKDRRSRFIEVLAASRRVAAPPLEEGPPDARKTLVHTLAKALEPEKEGRFRSGAEFAEALDGCRELQTAEREMPPQGWFTRAAWRHPFRWIMILAVGPQLVGSVVNISYNFVEIVSKLTPTQQETFNYWLVPVYNAVAYPVLVGLGVGLVLPLYRVWRKLSGTARVDDAEVAAARRHALSLPLWMLVVAGLGWLPGGFLFPLLLHHYDPPLNDEVFAHFIASFTLSGLIAVAYSFCGLQHLVMRVFYPRLWTDATHFRSHARRELSGTKWRLRIINWLSGAIPIAAVAMMLLIELLWGDGGGVDQSALALVLGLVLLGGIGRELTTTVTSGVAKAYAALTGRPV